MDALMAYEAAGRGGRGPPFVGAGAGLRSISWRLIRLAAANTLRHERACEYARVEPS